MSCANTSSYGTGYINLSAGNNRWWPEKWFSPTSTTTTFLFGFAAAVNRNFFKTTAASRRRDGGRGGRGGTEGMGRTEGTGTGSGTGDTFRTITTETRVKSSRFKSHKGDRRKRAGRKRFAMTGSRKCTGFRETDGTRVSRAKGFFLYRKRFFFSIFYIVPRPLFNGRVLRSTIR